MDELFRQPLPNTTVVMILLLALPFVLGGMIQALKAWDKYLTKKENEEAALQAKQQNNDASL